MNFEIFCFDLENLNAVVHLEYTNSYIDALSFEKANKFSCISITPMNDNALHEMACVQCGGKYGQEACRTCRHR